MEIVDAPQSQSALERLASGRMEPKARFDLKTEAERLSLMDGFDRLLTLDVLDLHLYDHQRAAALRILREMRGRALLADEVGLGKTIEAGVILKEYVLRSLVKRVLILVPASLVAQWHRELKEKLALEFRVARTRRDFEKSEFALASIDAAKRPSNAEVIHRFSWDLVIVDEAHRLKNSATANWRFVNDIQKKQLLLLTATPVQNDLKELYNLVTLLKPGQLKTFSQFKKEFMIDKRSPKNTPRLKEVLKEVMVRTSRRESLIPFPSRKVESISIPLGEGERRYYDGALSVLRAAYRAMPKEQKNILPLILVLKQACSHPKAAQRTLEGMVKRGSLVPDAAASVDKLSKAADGLTPAKLAPLLAAMRNHDGKTLVFTEFRATQRELIQALQDAGLNPVAFHGGMTHLEKERAVEAFRQDRPVMISTEAGGEGRNLQFCRLVVNYDLPWNPMRIEQRIGRAHRLGQTKPVTVVNLVTEGTLEAYVLYLLEQKLGMFSRVIGEIDDVLANVKISFEEAVASAALSSRSDQEFERRIERFGRTLEGAFAAYERVQRLNADILDAQ